MRSLREWLGDVKAGIGFYHFAHPDHIGPDGYPAANLCNERESGYRLIWWFTPLCPKCKRLSACGAED